MWHFIYIYIYRGAWWAVVHGFSKSRTQLGDFTFTFHFHALEKEMAAHSSVLAWRVLGMGLVGCRLWGLSSSSIYLYGILSVPYLVCFIYFR